MGNDAETARQVAIIDAATGIFLRYGFKKTTMEDIARTVGISRQALYLYFPTKEAVFKAMVSRTLEAMRTEATAALTRDDRDIEERLLGAFAAMHGKAIGAAYLGELMAAMIELVGPVFDEVEKAVVSEVADALDAAGIAARWNEAGVSARDLAANLSATSGGLKRSVTTPAEYLDRMRIAVKIVCWGAAPEAASRSRRSS
ncbi:TetR/AcrR family transcriptional regulator [Methylosinus sp. LW4]|uniref:TetR/AcrR family transcriptional regulator n=1 Tax=Methylosinus sp. LW4 TaxID=136993 RepID=UPI0004784016|nr:TetR/AcrR family transcriptional regulator [Methylosinus sp. LW4]